MKKERKKERRKKMKNIERQKKEVCRTTSRTGYEERNRREHGKRDRKKMGKIRKEGRKE